MKTRTHFIHSIVITALMIVPFALLQGAESAKPLKPKNDKWRDIVHAYLACISFADHQVGRVLEALENSPYKDNTIIVLRSDHGYPAITGWKENGFAIQTETHRYLRYGDGSEELYDHKTDLNEWINLAQRPEHSDLKKKLSGWIPKSLTPPPKTRKQKRPSP